MRRRIRDRLNRTIRPSSAEVALAADRLRGTVLNLRARDLIG